MADVRLQETNGIRLAIEGCGHGTLHAIYASIEEACKQKGWPGVDLLIIGGDFQSVRNAFDLNCVSMPQKYRSMCDFHEYYSGQRLAPYLTVFVGGNHEASNYLFELYYGGWVAPNIYYMGAANVLSLGPLRIAGMSGIWKGFDYRKSHHERVPYNESDLRSVYHVREIDTRKLLQIRTQVDVGISHDWPQGVEWKGNWKRLFNRKKHFERDARDGRLGSVAAKQVMKRLRPRYWFSAHLHCKFAAVVKHSDGQTTQAQLPLSNETSSFPTGSKNEDEMDLNDEEAVEGTARPSKNSDEIDLDMDDGDVAPPAGTLDGAIKATNHEEIDLDLDEDDNAPTSQTNEHTTALGDVEEARLAEARAALPAAFAKPVPKPVEPIEHPPDITNTETSFLALDKCLEHRDFLQLTSVRTGTEVPARPLRLEYDREWLAITRAFALTEPPAFGLLDSRPPQAKSESEYRALIDEHRQWVDQNIEDSALVIPENFTVVAPIYDGGDFRHPQYQQVQEYPNPQTRTFCQLIQITNPLEISDEEIAKRSANGPRPDDFNTEFGGRGHGRGRFDGGRGRGRGRGRRGGGRGRGRGR